MPPETLIDQDLRALAEQLPFDVWVRDREHRLVYANRVARERWPTNVGSRPEQEPGLAPETLAVWRRNNERALGGEVVRGEERFVVDGRSRTILNVVAPIGSPGAIRGTIGLNIDVSDVRDAEARANRLATTLRELFEHAPIAIGIREIRGDDLLHVEDNPRTAALLGSSPAALRGLTDREIGVSSEQVARTIERFRRSKSAAAPVDFEITYPFPAGPRVLVGKVVPIPGESPEAERYAYFGEDVTHVRELEAGLLHADRLATLGTLAASIGHEIKNPASYTAMHLQLAIDRLEHGALDEVTRASLLDDLRVASDGLDRIVTLVRDMMRLASPKESVLGAVNLTEVVDSVLSLAGAEIRDHARLVRSDGVVPKVHANAMRLAQVVLNLVSNALRVFGDRRGTLWIDTESVAADRASLTISDDGPGLPAEIRARLFQPFVTTASRSGNSGLGLYVSHEIITSMNGTIRADDRPGGGTAFRIELPVHVEAEAAPTRT